jgi:acetylornithine deacetylase/succinyl-diaminopimelate desuccinylase-like protein
MTASPTASETLTDLEQRVLASIETREADLFDRLETLVRFRTPNPPGGNEGPAQDWMEERLRSLGMDVDR